MLNAIITHKENTSVVEFPMDLYKLYQDLHDIGYQGGPHRVKLTDNEGDDMHVKLYSDNDFGNHLILLFNENDTLEDVHTVSVQSLSRRTRLKSSLKNISFMTSSTPKMNSTICSPN